jgi:hypothetical protein
VDVLREVMPAACAVDSVRRELVEQELALVFLVEHDARAYVHTAIEFGGDVGESVMAHFSFLLWLPFVIRFFFWPKIPRFRKI